MLAGIGVADSEQKGGCPKQSGRGVVARWMVGPGDRRPQEGQDLGYIQRRELEKDLQEPR